MLQQRSSKADVGQIESAMFAPPDMADSIWPTTWMPEFDPEILQSQVACYTDGVRCFQT